MTIQKLLKKAPVFLHLWKDSADVYLDFKEPKHEGKILFAVYDYFDYSGKAFILYYLSGKLYEVNGSHCSCFGLEDQWKPEETTIEVLNLRLEKGELGRQYGYDKEGDFKPFALEIFE